MAMQQPRVHCTKLIDSGEERLEIIKSEIARSPMRRQTVTPPSSLPSLMMPCPACAGRMVFHVRRPVTAEVEDTVYACRSCGTELIRTSVRQKSQNSAEAA
jgi:DNA-directed RNA polymerase subunit RPC12/RpoP